MYLYAVVLPHFSFFLSFSTTHNCLLGTIIKFLSEIDTLPTMVQLPTNALVTNRVQVASHKLPYVIYLFLNVSIFDAVIWL